MSRRRPLPRAGRRRRSSAPRTHPRAPLPQSATATPLRSTGLRRTDGPARRAPTHVRLAPSPTAPVGVAPLVAPRRSASLAAAAVSLSAAKRSLAQAQRRAAPQRHHDALVGPSGAVAGSSAARAETLHAALGDGTGPDGTFPGASVFVVCKHGALVGRANGIWQDFGGRRKRGETPYATAFREMREEIGLTAGHVGILHGQPTWVVHAGYRHAVFIATLSEAN